jgi:hypothetical protein
VEVLPDLAVEERPHSTPCAVEVSGRDRDALRVAAFQAFEENRRDPIGSPGSPSLRLLPWPAVLEVRAVGDHHLDPFVENPGTRRSTESEGSLELTDNEESEEQHLGRGARAIVGGEPSIVLLCCRDN